MSIVSRGFTDHEELDSLGLVNMNGRIYDPGIGRFMSADPYVQAPTVTQNFNRYSYVVNNPLSLSDPSGFNIFGNFFKWLSNALGPIGAQVVIAVASIAIGVVTAGVFTAVVNALLAPGWVLTSFGSAVVSGAGFGFGSAFSGSLLCGASIGQAFQAGLIGGLIGGISGGLAQQIGDVWFPSSGHDFLSEMFSFNHLARSVGHAILGGAASEVQNGNWEEGALSGGVSEGLAPAVNLFDVEAERVAASAVIGGTAAELGGGKFVNGAVTAAFLRLYNDEGVGERLVSVIRSQLYKAVWGLGSIGANMADEGSLMASAMNHADGTTPGDWQLSSREIAMLRGSPGYEKFIMALKMELASTFDGVPDGTYRFSTDPMRIGFTHFSDAYYAVGHAYFSTSGIVTITDGKAVYSMTVTMVDSFHLAPEKWYTPTDWAYHLQQNGYLHPFTTRAVYQETVSWIH